MNGEAVGDLKNKVKSVKSSCRCVEMSKVEKPGALVEQRRAVAESLSHTAVITPDIQQLLVSKEEVPHEQQEWSPCLDQEDLELPHIKKEQEELWTSQEGEQLQGLEEADITKFPFTSVSVKSEDDDEKPRSSQVHQSQTEENRVAESLTSSSTEQMKTEADEEDCGISEPARNLDPGIHLQPTSDGKTSHSSEPESEDSDYDWMLTKEPQSGLDSVKNDEILESHNRSDIREKCYDCSVCGKGFYRNDHLQRHMKIHTGEKPYVCSICCKNFRGKMELQIHMRVHTGEKPFSCSVCGKRFSSKSYMQKHMAVHTGEKLFSCSVCGKKFLFKSSMQRHMTVHTGEKPFSCSICGKAYSSSGNMRNHMRDHTGEKPFSCSVCDKRFDFNVDLQVHMKSHAGEKQFSCSVCGNTDRRKSHMRCIGCSLSG